MYNVDRKVDEYPESIKNCAFERLLRPVRLSSHRSVLLANSIWMRHWHPREYGSANVSAVRSASYFHRYLRYI